MPMWKTIAQALGLPTPERDLEALSPVLDTLWAQTRKALDRELGEVEPALVFRPDLSETP